MMGATGGRSQEGGWSRRQGSLIISQGWRFMAAVRSQGRMG